MRANMARVRCPSQVGGNWRGNESAAANHLVLLVVCFSLGFPPSNPPTRSCKHCSGNSRNAYFRFTSFPGPMSRVLSAAVVSSVGLISKAFLYSGLCSLQVNGLHNLEDALNSPRRAAGQGVVTGEPLTAFHTINLNVHLQFATISRRRCFFQRHYSHLSLASVSTIPLYGESFQLGTISAQKPPAGF